MPLRISRIDELGEYLNGVFYRATHHAENVNHIIIALAGVLVLLRDPGTPLAIRTRLGELGNAMWVTTGGTRYVLSYNHSDASVEVRRRTQQGQVEGLLNNDTAP